MRGTILLHCLLAVALIKTVSRLGAYGVVREQAVMLVVNEIIIVIILVSVASTRYHGFLLPITLLGPAYYWLDLRRRYPH